MISSDIVSQSDSTVRSMIDLKVKMHRDRDEMENIVEECKDKLTALNNNITILEKTNEQLEQAISVSTSHGGADKITVENIGELISCPDPFSEKIVHLVAKHNALEDCMASVKKGFEKGVITLPDFLKQIRQLSMKQCKQITKMQKINAALKPGL